MRRCEAIKSFSHINETASIPVVVDEVEDVGPGG